MLCWRSQAGGAFHKFSSEVRRCRTDNLGNLLWIQCGLAGADVSMHTGTFFGGGDETAAAASTGALQKVLAAEGVVA